MQHFEPRFLHDDASPHADQVPARSIVWGVGLCALVVQSAREFVCRGSDPARRSNSPTNFRHRWCLNRCEPECHTSLVSDTTLIRARAGDHQAFAALTDPYRRELQLHCYRILGQVQDAEDAMQETLLSAWRALESLEERSTLRSWLYRIATNRCLNMLRHGGTRPSRPPR